MRDIGGGVVQWRRLVYRGNGHLSTPAPTITAPYMLIYHLLSPSWEHLWARRIVYIGQPAAGKPVTHTVVFTMWENLLATSATHMSYFYPFKVVDRGSDTQLQAGENYIFLCMFQILLWGNLLSALVTLCMVQILQHRKLLVTPATHMSNFHPLEAVYCGTIDDNFSNLSFEYLCYGSTAVWKILIFMHGTNTDIGKSVSYTCYIVHGTTTDVGKHMQNVAFVPCRMPHCALYIYWCRGTIQAASY